MRRTIDRLLVVAIVAGLAACGEPAAPSVGPTVADAPLPSPALVESAEAVDPEIERIIEFRRSLGLRHDPAYVLGLQDDPAARVFLLDFPMTMAEERELLAKQAETDRIIPVIQAYAARHESTFGGLYIDRDQVPGAVVVLFTDALLPHELALRADLGTAFIVLRQVRYSEAYLRSLQDAIARDAGWMEAIPARMWGVGTRIGENVVELEVSSAVPDAETIIAAHYDVGDALRVVSDGTGAMLIPAGTVTGTILLPNGDPVGENGLMLDAESDEPGKCGGGDIGYGVLQDGTFEYPCQAGTRTIIVRGPAPDGDGWPELGRATVEVPANGTVEVTIRLDEAP